MSELEELKEKLENPKTDELSRIAAVKALSKIGSPEAVVILLHALDTKQQVVRQEIIDSLGKMRADKAVPHLVEILEDGNDELQQHAVEALGCIGGIKAEMALQLQLASSSGEVRDSILSTLDKFEDPDGDEIESSAAEHTQLFLSAPTTPSKGKENLFAEDSPPKPMGIKHVATPSRGSDDKENEQDVAAAVHTEPQLIEDDLNAGLEMLEFNIEEEESSQDQATSIPASSDEINIEDPSPEESDDKVEIETPEQKVEDCSSEAEINRPVTEQAATTTLNPLRFLKQALEGANYQFLEDPDGKQHRIIVPLPKGRRQIIYIVTGNEDLEGDPLFYVYTICGPATLNNYEWALKSNMKRTHGALAVIEHGKEPLLVCVDSIHYGLCVPALLKKCITTLAVQGDKLEEMLTGKDER